MTPGVRDILTDREVIDIDQDSDGIQGRRVMKNGDQEVWSRPLAKGRRAIGFFNRGSESAKITIKWTDLGLKSAPAQARNLWTHSDLKLSGAVYFVEVPAHGVVMLRVQ